MREQELKLENVKKSCNTAKKVAKVFKILLIVCAVMCLVSAIFMLVLKGQINDGIASTNATNPGKVSIDKMDFRVGSILSYEMDTEKIAAEGTYAQAFALMCGFGGIMSIFVAVVFTLIEKIFVTIEREESPFSPKVLSTVKKLFIAIAVIIGLESGLGAGLLMGLFFWCLYCIMDYGFALQKEIDETL